MTDKPKHGGPRPGSGPKPLPPGQKKIAYAARLAPDIHAFLRSQDNATATLETAIRESFEFKWWVKNQ